MMASSDPGSVIAEVLLRDPQAPTFDKVARFLQQSGVQVTGRGATSLSIRCTPAQFEQLFQTRLRTVQSAGPREGVKAFGPLRHAAYEAEGTVTIPSSLAADVVGVYLQGPARLL